MVARNKVTLGGTLPGGEVWSCGLNYGPGAGGLVDNFADLQTWANSIKAAYIVNVGLATLKTLMGSNAALTTVTTDYYQDEGPVTQRAVSGNTPIPGTSSASPHPYQIASCISLRTGRPGQSYKGRVYWPAVNAPIVSATLRQSSAATDSQCSSFVALNQLITTEAPGVFSPQLVVYSPTLALLTPVSTVAVGDVLDVQRRRRDALAEVYSSLAV